MRTSTSKIDAEKYMNAQLTFLIHSGFDTFQIFSMFFGLLESIKNNMPNTLTGGEVEVLEECYIKLIADLKISKKSLN